MSIEPDRPSPSQARFLTTNWTQVLAAGEGQVEALEQLCQAYWYPAYAFFRRMSCKPQDAEDLVQSFFERRVLQGRLLVGISPAEGKFRSWFRESLRHHFSPARDHALARKRGGDATHVTLDLPGLREAEHQYQASQNATLSADLTFDRAYAVTLVSRVYRRLAAEYAAVGKTDLFTALNPNLTANAERGDVSRSSHSSVDGAPGNPAAGLKNSSESTSSGIVERGFGMVMHPCPQNRSATA